MSSPQSPASRVGESQPQRDPVRTTRALPPAPLRRRRGTDEDHGRGDEKRDNRRSESGVNRGELGRTRQRSARHPSPTREAAEPPATLPLSRACARHGAPPDKTSPQTRSKVGECGSPRGCNPLHPARARRDGDDRPGRPHLRGRERTRRGAQSAVNLQLLASCRRCEAGPASPGCTPSSRTRERVQVGGNVCRSVTPTARCTSAATT